MLREEIDRIIRGMPISASYKILNDLDGPGRGNAGLITREERPPEGGIYLHILNYKYPFKGSPHTQSVNNLHIFKKSVFFAIKSIQSRRVEVLLGILFLLPRFLTRGLISAIVDYYYWMMNFLLKYDFIKSERYCPCVRELHRTFTVLAKKEKTEWKRKIIEIVREIICMLIEFDSAYKFRFQDIICELNKAKMKDKRMLVEIGRLFDLMAERERPREAGGDCMAAKWQRVKKIILELLKRIKFARQLAENFFKEIDLEKLKPDEADRYFDLLRKDYDFFGKPLPERIEMRKKIEGENWKYFEELANSFLWEYNILEKYKTFKNYYAIKNKGGQK